MVHVTLQEEKLGKLNTYSYASPSNLRIVFIRFMCLLLFLTSYAGCTPITMAVYGGCAWGPGFCSCLGSNVSMICEHLF